MAMTAATTRPRTVRRYGSQDYSLAGQRIEDIEPFLHNPILPTPVPRREPPALPKRSFQHKLGSKQVVSIRGRRVDNPKADIVLVRVALLCIALAISGILGATILSGTTTQQTFHIQKLSAEETQLENQLEALRRDLEQSRGAAGVAHDAAAHHLVVPVKAGALNVAPDGHIDEVLPVDPALSRPIIDVSGGRRGSGAANSDPHQTREVAGTLEPAHPGRNAIAGRDFGAESALPYAPRPAHD